MKWLLGGLVVGALLAGLLFYRQEHRPTRCERDAVILSGLAPRGSSSGEREPDVAAGLAFDDYSDTETDPGSPSEDDDRIVYYSYGGDQRLDEIVVVERKETGRWTATHHTTCGQPPRQ